MRLKLICIWLMCIPLLKAQNSDTVRTEYMYINGERVQAIISPEDTLFLAEVDSIKISSPRNFADRQEYLKYVRYKKYAAKVYPYAKEAIRIFREAEYVTRYMNEKSQKVYLKNLQVELEREFENPLKKLSKTQGKILIEMIEKETEMPLYDLIQMTRGNFLASYYGTIGSFYDFNLREGYIEGKDHIMDIVISDFNLSYDIERVIEKNERERMPMMPSP